MLKGLGPFRVSGLLLVCWASRFNEAAKRSTPYKDVYYVLKLGHVKKDHGINKQFQALNELRSPKT